MSLSCPNFELKTGKMGGCGRKGDGGVPSHFDLRQLEHCKTLSVCLVWLAGSHAHTNKQMQPASYGSHSTNKSKYCKHVWLLTLFNEDKILLPLGRLVLQQKCPKREKQLHSSMIMKTDPGNYILILRKSHVALT